MVQINFAMKEVNCKIVYYGPGMSGKTTNLEIVHKKAPEQHRGDLTSISTDGDRTLFFDFMPLDLGTIAGMRTKFQLYTVPGQVYYNSTRKLVLQGVDGVVFVADSDPGKLQENLESLQNLEENLREYGKELKSLAHVFQWNKRDLPNAMSVAELNEQLNRYGANAFDAVAKTGEGVFPTLKALAAAVLESLNRRESSSRGPSAPSAPVGAGKVAAGPASSSAPRSGSAVETPPAGFTAGSAFPPSMAPAASGAPRPQHAAPRAPGVARPAPAPSSARPAPHTAVAAPPRPVARVAAPRPAAPAARPVRAAAPAHAAPSHAPAPVHASGRVRPAPRKNTAVVIGVVIGTLGALALLGVAFLFFFQ